MLQKFKLSDKLLFYVTLACVTVVLVVIALQSEGTFDSGDGVQHYLIARYAFSHPELLLDMWGKPLFTLIASPFAQFGLRGMFFFNILCGVLSSVFAFRIAQRLNLKQTWTLPVFICFAPIFFAVMNSGLTEPLFACVLILAILFLFEERYVSAAIVASFFMFLRPEANFVLPVFALFFLLKKKYLHIGLLATGFVVYTIIGYFHFSDVLWVINQTPYNENNATTYGETQGDAFYYFKHYDVIVGLPLVILFVSGIVYALVRLIPGIKHVFENSISKNFRMEEYILLYGSLFSIIVGHSMVWGFNIFPTLGMERYMTSMIPLFAIMCLSGLNLLIFFFNRVWILQLVIAVAFAWWLITIPFNLYFYPFRLNPEQAVVADAAEWLNENPDHKKVYYLHPYVAAAFHVDPFDKENISQLWSIDPTQPGVNIPSGSIIIWDAHFGPNECKLPLDTMKNCPDYELLHSFHPEVPFDVLGGHPFQVCVFRRR